MNRRQALEALRAGPALVTDFPGDAVDVDGLLAHLIARGFEGGIYLADLEMESLVWVHDGAAQDAWFFDVEGGEAVLPGLSGHDLFREMAANGSMLSVYVGEPPDVAIGQTAGPPSAAPATVFQVPGSTAPPESPEAPAVPAGHAPPAADAPVVERPGVESAPERIVATVATEPALVAPAPVPPAPVAEPSPRPWPRILEGVAERVARHRGQRLAQRFIATLAAALAPHGGRVDGERIFAPPMSEAAWRTIVEAACAPIVAVAGRAFVDRSIAAAAQDARNPGQPGGDQ